MKPNAKSQAPDYTTACLVMFGVNVTWVLVAIWAFWGLLMVMVTALFINHLMTRLQIRAQEKAQQDLIAPRAKTRW